LLFKDIQTKEAAVSATYNISVYIFKAIKQIIAKFNTDIYYITQQRKDAKEKLEEGRTATRAT
jgi:hypothetical protein